MNRRTVNVNTVATLAIAFAIISGATASGEMTLYAGSVVGEPADATTATGSLQLVQASVPPPIAVELLTGRAVFTDQVAMGLDFTIQDGEAVSMDLDAPGRSVVAKISVQPGAQFPWHTHPGPVFVNIAEGELVYVPASDCIERHYQSGTVFVDPGRGNVHTAYNPGEVVMVMIATFFEVPDEGPLTITEGVPIPTDCNVEVGMNEPSH